MKVRTLTWLALFLAGGILAGLPNSAAQQLLNAPALQPNRVEGNLVLLNDNGAWSWYQDERAIIDPSSGSLLVSSVAASPLNVDGPRDGNVDLTTFDLSTGQRTRVVLGSIQEDDHNLAALLKRPDGRYLAVYANHNTDRVTRYRISTHPEDATAWGPERTFDWRETPGNDFNVTYSNLFYLPTEKRVYNFARVNDRSPNMILSTDQGESWTYGGQVTRSEDVGYVNGYFKYASNGVDRIHLIATEAHPRDYNNGIYHAYIERGKLHGSDGSLIDADIFDNQHIPATNSLSPVFLPDQEDGTQQRHRAWTTDLALDSEGQPFALFTTRAGDAVPSPDGIGDDRRLYYARYNGEKWHCHEVAKMGRRLFRSEQDYTGLGALVPGDPNTVFVSSTINPATQAETPFHEIYRGQTDDAGRNWRWTAITAGSTVDNLRPIVPQGDLDHPTVLWFRGLMYKSQAYDAAIVGVIDSKDGSIGPIHYVAANDENTKTSNGQLVTEVSGLADGHYDLFAFFWGSVDGTAQLRTSLTPDVLLTASQQSSQAAESSQFAPGQDVAVRRGKDTLYRTYLGRVAVEKGAAVQVFVEDPATHDNHRTSYDGLGYARVETLERPSAVRPVERMDRNSQLAHEQLLRKVQSGRVDVYFIGDSITRRWGATDYPELLKNWKENFHGWNAGNFAWGADQTQHMLWRLLHGELDGVNPKVIVILAGTNNVGNAPNEDSLAAEVTEGIQEIVRVCQTKAPDATIILTGILPRNDNPRNPLAAMPVINKVNENLEELADGKQVRFLNINHKLADSQGQLHNDVTMDNLHLNRNGYQLWADALKPLLTELLGPPSEVDLAPPPTGDPSAAN